MRSDTSATALFKYNFDEMRKKPRQINRCLGGHTLYEFFILITFALVGSQKHCPIKSRYNRGFLNIKESISFQAPETVGKIGVWKRTF